MKARLLIFCFGVLFTLTIHAGLIIPGGAFANSGYIPDGSAVGSFGKTTVSHLPPSISDVSVKLNISGGYNGDLYAYLSHGGMLVPLLNRVGVTSGNAFGYGEAGMNVTLSDQAITDIHSYGALVSPYTYQPDGRIIDPQSAAGDLYNASRVSFSSQFGGRDPNGTWTLFLADLSSGGGQSQLLGWSLDITAVPEPVSLALGVFAGVFLVVFLIRSQPVRSRAHRWRVAVVRWIDAV